jgi:hypothetical protein
MGSEQQQQQRGKQPRRRPFRRQWSMAFTIFTLLLSLFSSLISGQPVVSVEGSTAAHDRRLRQGKGKGNGTGVDVSDLRRRRRYCANLARRLCVKCTGSYKRLVKKRKCVRNKRKCRLKFKNCLFDLFGRRRILARRFRRECDNRLSVAFPTKNIFGRTKKRARKRGPKRGRKRGRGVAFDYRKMLLKDWCPRPKVKPPKLEVRGTDDVCGPFQPYFAELVLELETCKLLITKRTRARMPNAKCAELISSPCLHYLTNQYD